jgi:hypothetical protein
LLATQHVLVGDKDRVGVRDGELDGIFVGCGETDRMREGWLDDVGLKEDVGITDVLGDAGGELLHTGRLQRSNPNR